MANYHTDVIKWSKKQAKLLLAGDFECLDIENIADEILDVGKAEIRYFENHLSELLMFLILYAYYADPRGRDWRKIIQFQRKRVMRLLEETPSLIDEMDDEFWRFTWFEAKFKVEQETGIMNDSFADELPWSYDNILNADWLPEAYR